MKKKQCKGGAKKGDRHGMAWMAGEGRGHSGDGKEEKAAAAAT